MQGAATNGDGPPALVGFTYQITVSNQGPDPASSVHAGLLIPAGATISTISPGGSVSGQVVTWSAGTLAANQTTAFEVTVQIGARPGRRLLWLAACYSNTLDPNPLNNFAATVTRIQ